MSPRFHIVECSTLFSRQKENILKQVSDGEESDGERESRMPFSC